MERRLVADRKKVLWTLQRENAMHTGEGGRPDQRGGEDGEGVKWELGREG